MLSLPKAPSRGVVSLQNWVDGTGALAREETAFLGSRDDLAGLVSSRDTTMSCLEAWVEDVLIRFHHNFRQVCAAN